MPRLAKKWGNKEGGKSLVVKEGENRTTDFCLYYIRQLPIYIDFDCGKKDGP
jgi:hypothetical protein